MSEPVKIKISRGLLRHHLAAEREGSQRIAFSTAVCHSVFGIPPDKRDSAVRYSLENVAVDAEFIGIHADRRSQNAGDVTRGVVSYLEQQARSIAAFLRGGSEDGAGDALPGAAAAHAARPTSNLF